MSRVVAEGHLLGEGAEVDDHFGVLAAFDEGKEPAEL
jgi:hypothetical protein